MASTNSEYPGFSTIASQASNPTMCTPIHQNQSVSISTPAVIIFGTPPNWAMSFNDDRDQNSPPFASITSAPSDSPNGTHTTNFTSMAPKNAPNRLILSDNPFDVSSNINIHGQDSRSSEPPAFGSGSIGTNLGFGSWPDTHNVTQSLTAPARPSTQPVQTRIPPQATNFSTPRNAVMRSILPGPTSALVPVSVPGSASAVAHSSALVLVSAPAPYGHQSLSQSSQTPPTNIPASQPISRPLGNPNPPPRQVTVLQSSFGYDEVCFIQAMKKRWVWYLVAENCYPTNTLAAREACIVYAEEALGVTRLDYPRIRQMFDYVRASDLV